MSEKDKQLEKQIQRLVMLSELGKTFTSTMNLEDLQKSILKKTSDILRPESWHLLIKNPETDKLEYKILINDPSVDRSKPVEIGEGLSGWVAHTQQAVLWSQGFENEITKAIPPAIQKEAQDHSIVCAPLRSKNQLLGVMSLQHSDPGFFSEEDVRTLSTIADFAAIAFENAMNYERIEQMTVQDDLTRLYNQRYLHQLLDHEVDRANRYLKEFSMIFIDLDKFKQVNDTYGHVHGSDLLREAAEIILESTRDVDHCARYGGDEFVIVLPETDKAKALVSAERIRNAIETNVFLQEKGINAKFTASFGVASFPEDAQTKDDLIKMADEAMYEAKHKNRNIVQGYKAKS